MHPPKKPSSQLLPNDTVRCVWMDAGLLKWKLCDRQLECERCPLDAALKGHPLDAVAEAAAGRRRPAWVFPDDRRYARGHVWVQVSEPRRFRIGLDILVADLLPEPRRLVLPEEGDRVQRGAPLAVLEVDGGEVNLPAPLTGRVLRTNHVVARDPVLAMGSPYTAGWLVELDPEEAPEGEALDALLTGGEMRREARLDVQRLQRQVAMEVLVGRPEVGPVMADGGEPVTDLKQMLGPRRYLTLVQELLR